MEAQLQMLNNGQEIPSIGLGTYKIKDPLVISSVLDAALEYGYKMVDTAAVYKNEASIGDILRQLCPKHNLEPKDIFVTSKLAPRDQGYEKALAAFYLSLEALGRPQLDLYLIHWPGAQGFKRDDPRNGELRRESWKALEELHSKGVVKSIGVSNYTVRHLKEMENYASIMPHVLQSECHPALPQKDLREYCREHNVYFQAYSSLGCGKLVENASVVSMATSYKKTPAQLLLKWALQQGIGVIPKTSVVERVRENHDIFDFELSSEDMETLVSLFPAPHHFCWDPSGVA